MLSAQVVINSAAAQVWSGQGIGDGAIFRNHRNVFCSIDKNLVPGQQFVAFVEAGSEIIEKLRQLRNEILRQIANLSAHTRVRGGKTRAGQQFEQIIKLFSLIKG